MREKLFRGKRADNGQWIEGDLIHKHWVSVDNFIDCAIRYLINGIYSYPTQVIPKTVGQFVGIRDKEGNKVFKGQIVKDRSGRIMEIVYHNFRYQFKAITETNFTYADFYSWQTKYFQDGYNKDIPEEEQCFNIEIIGNIFDNPELLQS